MHALLRNTWADLAAFFYRAMGWLPMPAQDKWTGSLQLFRLHVRLVSQLSVGDPFGSPFDDPAAISLHETGRKWVEKRFLWFNSGRYDTSAAKDTVSVALKTLNLPSIVETSGDGMTVTTVLCPFLDDAKRANESLSVVCERVCGDRMSFFKGISEGFPFAVSYSAPHRMGTGSETCQKELTVRSIRERKRNLSPANRIASRPPVIEMGEASKSGVRAGRGATSR
ncbi:MAG: hypothetical protein FJ317_02870 [SAR202 cluster bacterium]|nr:hypothetical protein [SAR202 cluster bacterium]